jgi:hypothetical protein
MKTLVAVALLAGATWAHAQTAASAPVSQAKKDLVAKVLVLQQPGYEAMARDIVMRPAVQLGQEAGAALQNVPADKRESVGKSIDADIRKFIEESKRAIKAAPTTIAPILEEKMTEDELKQLVAWLDSPTAKKYQQVGGELQNAMGQKLIAEAGPLLTPKLQALAQKVRVSLGVPPPANGASGAAPKPAAKPASK